MITIVKSDVLIST